MYSGSNVNIIKRNWKNITNYRINTTITVYESVKKIKLLGFELIIIHARYDNHTYHKPTEYRYSCCQTFILKRFIQKTRMLTKQKTRVFYLAQQMFTFVHTYISVINQKINCITAEQFEQKVGETPVLSAFIVETIIFMKYTHCVNL